MVLHRHLAIFIACLALASTCSAANVPQHAFGVFIDAGSTGSRAFVYTWDSRVFSSVPFPLTHPTTLQNWSARKSPGISSFVGRPAELRTYLQDLVSAAASMVRNQTSTPLDSFPILLFATAGMRVLPDRDRESVLSTVRSFFASDDCPFYFKPSFARVISGEEEGVFGWVSVNYEQGTLESDNATVGALDLGGASTQITFKPHEDIMANLYDLQIGQTVFHTLYTHSFLYYGINEATARVTDIVAGDAEEGAVVQHPCLPVNYTAEARLSKGVSVIIRGSGNTSECFKAAQQLLHKDTPCMTQPSDDKDGHSTCSVNGVYQPALAGEFVAFSAFGYLPGALRVPARSSLATLASATEPLCETDISELRRLRPDLEPNFLHTYCFSGVYTVTLLHGGYRFPMDSTHVTFASEVNGQPISFAVGAMLHATNALDYSFSVPCAEHKWRGLFIGAATVAGVTLLATAALAVLLVRAKARRRRDSAMLYPLA